MAKEYEKTNEAKEETKAGTKDVAVEEATQLEPYPTGNPPDPMEEYYKAHPERKLEAERARKEQEPKPAPEEEPEPEDDQPDEAVARNTKKGGKQWRSPI